MSSQFFDAILPDTGVYCAVGIKNGIVQQKFFSEKTALYDASQSFKNNGYDAYYACATFKTDERGANNVEAVKSLWVDLDCGDGKGYPDKVTALKDLQRFCKELALPKPTIVDSGYGLHAYWPFNETLTKTEWVQLAKALKAATLKHNLFSDQACTADAARILRVPGTLNFKNSDRVDVETLVETAGYEVGVFREVLKKYEVQTLPPVKRELDATTKALMGNYESNFAKIVRKSLGGNGCEQIKNAIDNADTLPEPLWYAALSIAVRCSDGETAIQKMSMAHPEYDPGETTKKANGTAGPRTCEWYRNESGYGSLCNGCERKITSPIQLGKELIVGELDEPVVVVEEQSEEALSVNREEPKTPALIEYTIPPYPYPFMRGKNGGIYKREEKPDGEVEDVLVYEYDLYVIKRIYDPNEGECAVLRLHLPMDGVREFSLPLRAIQSTDKMRDALSNYGVTFTRKNGLPNLMSYTSAFVRQLQEKLRAEEARMQFGWADGNTKFILGTREFSRAGTAYSPPSSATRKLAPHLDPCGDFDYWKKCFNIYKPIEKSSPAHVFALLTAFGSPLLKFTGTAGALISLVNETSGTGKTTLLELIASVYGSPKEMLMMEKDTEVSKLHRMGVLNCLPTCFDEMTNSKPEVLSNLVYSISQGRGKHRMRADVNEERVNTTTWTGCGVSNGNSSIIAKLAANKATSDGEMMRVLEFKVQLAKVEGAGLLLADLKNHYGHAGGVYADWLVRNAEQIPRLIADGRKKINEWMGSAEVKERFWMNTITANYVGGVVAKNLGLLDYDVAASIKWVCRHAVKQRAEVANNILKPDGILGEFMNSNFGSIIVVDELKKNPMTLSNIIKGSNNKVVGRVEVHTGMFYVSKRELKDYCVLRQMDLENVLECTTGEYRYRGVEKKRLASGTGTISSPVETFKFELFGEMMTDVITKAIEPGT